MKALPDFRQQNYHLDPNPRPRQRDFDSKSFFLSMVLLVVGANSEGFLHALAKAFGALGLDDKRPNFKLILNLLAQRLHEVWYRFRKLIVWLSDLIKESTEIRKRCSRRYLRQLRKPASPYPYNNTEWAWDKAYDLW